MVAARETICWSILLFDPSFAYTYWRTFGHVCWPKLKQTGKRHNKRHICNTLVPLWDIPLDQNRASDHHTKWENVNIPAFTVTMTTIMYEGWHILKKRNKLSMLNAKCFRQWRCCNLFSVGIGMCWMLIIATTKILQCLHLHILLETLKKAFYCDLFIY